MIARFRLIEQAGFVTGLVDLELDDGPPVVGIGVDLMMLARNDPAALRFPPAGDPALGEVLLPQLRMLARGRVVPFAAELRF